MAKISKNDLVTIIDNGKKTEMTRGAAIELYFEAMLATEGSAQNRYCQIYVQLCNGNMVCTDGY